MLEQRIERKVKYFSLLVRVINKKALFWVLSCHPVSVMFGEYSPTSENTSLLWWFVPPWISGTCPRWNVPRGPGIRVPILCRATFPALYTQEGGVLAAPLHPQGYCSCSLLTLWGFPNTLHLCWAAVPYLAFLLFGCEVTFPSTFLWLPLPLPQTSSSHPTRL